MINPYEFMGLTFNSTIDDLRKAYYTMSLSCHPDKGGSNEAMAVLHTAYKYIKSHLDNIKDQPDSGKSYDELQAEFDNFIKEQDAVKPPTFLNIIAESFNINPVDYMEIYYDVCPDIPGNIMYDLTLTVINEMIRSKMLNQQMTEDDAIKSITRDDILAAIRKDLTNYNKLNNKEGTYGASIPDGYGALMDKSEVVSTEEQIPRAPGQSFGKREMVIYHEPDSVGGSEIAAGDIPILQKKDDYTIFGPKMDSLPITDYRRAYSEESLDTASSIFAGLCGEESIDILLVKQKMERARLDDVSKLKPAEIVKLKM